MMPSHERIIFVNNFHSAIHTLSYKQISSWPRETTGAVRCARVNQAPRLPRCIFLRVKTAPFPTKIMCCGALFHP